LQQFGVALRFRIRGLLGSGMSDQEDREQECKPAHRESLMGVSAGESICLA
jgi:hypothetical protein